MSKFRSSKEIREEQQRDRLRCDACPPDGQCKACRMIEQMQIELLLVGFALAKEIASLRKLTSGEMPCPLCKKTLRFSIAPSNGHMAAKCETEGCIHAME